MIAGLKYLLKNVMFLSSTTTEIYCGFLLYGSEEGTGLNFLIAKSVQKWGKFEHLSTVLSCGLCAGINIILWLSQNSFINKYLVTFSYFMGGCFVSLWLFLVYVIHHETYLVLLMAPLRLSEMVLCLVLSDDRRKRNKSTVHVFKFSSHVKNMHD